MAPAGSATVNCPECGRELIVEFSLIYDDYQIDLFLAGFSGCPHVDGPRGGERVAA